MKIIHMGDFKFSDKEELASSMPENGIVIEASKEELQRMGLEMLSEEVLLLGEGSIILNINQRDMTVIQGRSAGKYLRRIFDAANDYLYVCRDMAKDCPPGKEKTKLAKKAFRLQEAVENMAGPIFGGDCADVDETKAMLEKAEAFDKQEPMALLPAALTDVDEKEEPIAQTPLSIEFYLPSNITNFQGEFLTVSLKPHKGFQRWCAARDKED